MNESQQLVFLAGFMGSGKSTVGPLLAREIHFGFIDADSIIEKKENLSVRDIFRTRGEKYFRGLEENVLKEIVLEKGNNVVALGGGALASELNRILVKKSGILVYLKSDAANILERLRARSNRPMLLSTDGQPLTEDELSVRVASLLREREKYYLEASIVVDTSKLSISESVKEIVLKLRDKII